MESKNIDKNDEKFIINKLASNIDIIYKTLDNSIFNVNYDLYVYIKSKFINMDSLLPFLEEHNEEGIIDSYDIKVFRSVIFLYFTINNFNFI